MRTRTTIYDAQRKQGKTPYKNKKPIEKTAQKDSSKQQKLPTRIGIKRVNCICCSTNSMESVEKSNSRKRRKFIDEKILGTKAKSKRRNKTKQKGCFENKSFQRSNDSVLEHFAQGEFEGDLEQSIKILDRNQIIDPPIFLSEEDKRKYEALSGKTFVRDDERGGITEISFKPVMMMHLKKKTANVDTVESECKKGLTKNVALLEGYSLLNEVNRTRTSRITDSNSFLKPNIKANYGELQCQTSSREALRVKSSRNFLDLSYERERSQTNQYQFYQCLFPPKDFTQTSRSIGSTSTNNFLHSNYESFQNKDVQEIMLPKHSRPSLKSTISKHWANHDSGDCRPFKSSTSFVPLQNYLPFSRSVISNLHSYHLEATSSKKLRKSNSTVEGSQFITTNASYYQQN